jgi:hypothetical protein
LGAEHRIEEHNTSRELLGIALTGLFAIGLVASLRRHRWGFPAATVLLTLAAVYFLVGKQYSYGGYKLILLEWWCLAGCLTAAAEFLITRLPTRPLRWSVAGLLTVLGVLLLHQGLHTTAVTGRLYVHSPHQGRPMSEFRVLRDVPQTVGSAPILVQVGDWLANEWAVYFLRDQPMYLASYKMYMNGPGARAAMGRAKIPPLQDITWVLTDGAGDTSPEQDPGGEQVWSGGPYQLWKVSPERWAVVTNLRTPYRGEMRNGRPFAWLGQEECLLEVLAGGAGEMTLNADFVPGPSLSGTSVRHLRISTSSGWSQEWVTEGGPGSFTIPIPKGTSTISILPLDQPHCPETAKSARRIMLVGMEGLHVKFTPEQTPVRLGL